MLQFYKNLRTEWLEHVQTRRIVVEEILKRRRDEISSSQKHEDMNQSPIGNDENTVTTEICTKWERLTDRLRHCDEWTRQRLPSSLAAIVEWMERGELLLHELTPVETDAEHIDESLQRIGKSFERIEVSIIITILSVKGQYRISFNKPLSPLAT